MNNKTIMVLTGSVHVTTSGRNEGGALGSLRTEFISELLISCPGRLPRQVPRPGSRLAWPALPTLSLPSAWVPERCKNQSRYWQVSKYTV